MKSPFPTTRRRAAASIEPLEARIAPARVIWIDLTGSQGQNVDVHYDTPHYFVDTFVGQGTGDKISQAVGGYRSADPNFSSHPDETFYLQLNAGDKIIEGSLGTPVLTMLTGKAVAFFEDRNHDNEAQPSELVSLSIGKGAQFSLVGGLEGSVVANLNDAGTVDMNDLISTKNTIHNVSIAGNVSGSILGAGSISNLNLRNVGGIYAGTAALGQAYSFFPNLTNGTNGGNGTITSLSATSTQLQPAPGEAGAGISFIFADGVTVAKAGNGGFGAAGGALLGFQINGTSAGYTFTAGDGGAADLASHHVNGGAGGAVSYVYVKGFTDITPNDVISIHAGNGGAADGLGVGGTGGTVTQLYLGASLQGGKLVTSPDFVQDDVLVKAGNGGTGKSGGLGGSLITVAVTTNTPHDTNLAAHTAATPGLTHEVVLQAGDGGKSTDTTTTRLAVLHGGLGGNIRNLTYVDQSPEALPYDPTFSATALIQAGNGGFTTGPMSGPTALGAAGGYIYGANLVGGNLLVNAGDGSDGLTGGAGGTLYNVHLDRTPADFVHHAEFHSGNGGHGTLGNGGAGGAVLNLTTGEGDYTSFLVNVTAIANAGGFTYNPSGGKGGGSTSGFGGAGGAVNALDVLDIDSQVGFSPLAGDFVLNSGDGGAGGKGGGAGGAITNSLFNSTNMNAIITSGSGQAATVSGNGGAGGLIRNVQINLDNNVVATADPNHPLAPVAASAQITAGVGGSGIAYGGAGGSLITVVARVSNSDSQLAPPFQVTPMTGGDVSLVAGNGGAGGSGAPGAGGVVYLAGGFATVGSGTMIAGDAGSGGTRPAAGGSILGVSASALSALYATHDLTLKAGDGGGGGAGGRISYLGYGSTSATLLPVPDGNIIITAGDGSAYHSTAPHGVDYAGAGGSIANISGSVTSGAGKVTTITAGAGGAVAGGLRLGAGGSVSGLLIQRGPTDPTVPAGTLTITAGDAGNADGLITPVTANFGANGGSVSGVTVGDIGTQTVFRSIAAGDASAGLIYGGIGGSVLTVQVASHDIGVKTGQAYGYTTMGGIFAGLGGAGGRLSGAAGDVKVITANSITSIAAGKSNVPQLANTVAQISLNTVGTSTALPSDSGNDPTDVIEFTFHPPLVQTSSTGTSQTFERIPGGSNDQVEPAGGPSTFTLTIHDPSTGEPQTTIPLDADADASTIQSALEALPAIGTGGVGVSQTGASGGSTFTVTFSNAALAGSLTGVGAERTAPLQGNATPAQVHAALTLLQAVNDGGPNYPGIPAQTVTSPDTASYEIVYADSSMTHGDVTAEHLITHSAVETTVGTGTTSSVQHLELYGVGQFRIVYTPLTGAPPVTTDFLNVGATPTQVQTALSAAGIAATTVTEPGANTYDIHFTTTGAVGKLQVVEYASLSHLQAPNTPTGHEVQDLNFTPARAVDDIVFTLPASGDTITVAADQYTSTPVTAAQVEAALNSNSHIHDDGGVTVTLTPDNVFHVTFKTAANAETIHASEVLPAFFSTVSQVGTTQTSATELTMADPSTNTPEVQEVKLSPGTNYFQLSLDGATYSQALPSTATPAQVQAALDSLSTDPHYFDGGTDPNTEGNVTGVPGDYTVTFANDGQPHPPISVQEVTDQTDELIVSNRGSFHFANGVNTSPELSPNATAHQVETAMNSVLDPSHQVAVSMPPGSHGVYLVKYLDGQQDTPPQIVDTLPLAQSGPTGGVETLALDRPAIIDEAVYHNASIVGAIADLNHLGSNHFAFLDNVQGGAPGAVFQLGDTAIDGLIAAKNLSQKTLNFTPQARLIINSDVSSALPGQYKPVDPLNPTTPVFYDFLNDLV